MSLPGRKKESAYKKDSLDNIVCQRMNQPELSPNVLGGQAKESEKGMQK